MSFAVIRTGGKQYKVSEGTQLKIEKIAGEAGEKVIFDQVLLISDDKGESMELGQPVLTGKTVEADILLQARDRKINVVKYKSKTRYHKVYGHRQHFTKVKITKIGGAVKKETVKADDQKAEIKKAPVKKAPAVKKASVKK
ncbi:TPA: 50S ribosomal protein L21 [Candidatus Falkowbacteria bacterium]|nr:50S ribosomal protein L21 [Candidatus Falkowbacteria bacterium]